MAEEVINDFEQTSEGTETEVITLGEILQSEQQYLDDAAAVLGAGDEDNCTYSEGYLKRQALYACITCIPEAKSDVSKRAGVCLACSFNCHDGHELIELYTKRHFRCDCGNAKFGSIKCNLDNTKSECNEQNLYNQNFAGLYCVCHRPYPDPEDKVSDEMIQCIVCEDWYHSRHLGGEMPPANSYAEITCESCVNNHQFLLHYDGLCVQKIVPDEIDDSINIMDTTIDTTDNELVDANKTAELQGDNVGDGDILKAVIEENSQPKLSDDNIKEASTICKMPEAKSDQVATKFWTNVSWRQQLCTCESCMKMYEDENVAFLLDPQDTVQSYEDKGKVKVQERERDKLNNEMQFLNSLDRVPLMEAIAGYNDMKENLVEYLKKFAENKKVVRAEDIQEFFTALKSKKKQKMAVQYHCR